MGCPNRKVVSQLQSTPITMDIFGITLTASDISLLGVVGLCLAWLIPHRLTISRDQQNRFRAASTNFISAINTSTFSRANSRGLYNDFLKAHDAHASAAAEFGKFLGPIRRFRFGLAWKAYENHCHHRPADFEGLERHLEKLRSFANAT